MNPSKFKSIIKSLPTGAKVLDAGCGTGNNSRYILSIRKDLDLYCLDINSKYETNVSQFSTFDVASVENLKQIYKNNTFDCIISFHVLEHLHQPYKAINEFERILKVGGYMIAETPHWISTIMPFGFNFYDDPTHIRPFTKKTFKEYLFKDFNIVYLNFETPIFFYHANIYKINKFSMYYVLRFILKSIGLYKTAVFAIARKKKK